MNIHSFYQVAIIILLVILTGSSTVSAYYLNLDAPSEIRVGQSFEVTGTTNTPPPDKIDIVFSQSMNIPVEIARYSRDITEKGDNTFNATFETTGLEKGNYKIEAISQSQRDFSAGSRNLRVIKLTDRSDMIRFSSPAYQEFEKTLLVEARIREYDDNSIQMEVKYGNTSIFGPESVPVTRGFVKNELPITEEGPYSVIFNDYKGYIGSYHIQVGEGTTVADAQPSQSLSPVPDEKEVNATKATTATENPTDYPTSQTTQKSVETTKVTAESTPSMTEPTPSATSAQVISTGSASEISSTSQVSRDTPGYFLVRVKESPVQIQTSANEDWVLEYKAGSDAAIVKVNDWMKEAAEEATITQDTDRIFIKVYPYSYKTGAEITMTASNAHSIALSDEAAQAFGAPPRYGAVVSSENTQSPAPIAALICGIFGATWIFRRKDK